MAAVLSSIVSSYPVSLKENHCYRGTGNGASHSSNKMFLMVWWWLHCSVVTVFLNKRLQIWSEPFHYNIATQMGMTPKVSGLLGLPVSWNPAVIRITNEATDNFGRISLGIKKTVGSDLVPVWFQYLVPVQQCTTGQSLVKQLEASQCYALCHLWKPCIFTTVVSYLSQL